MNPFPFKVFADNRKAAPQTKIHKQSRGPKLLGLAVFAFVLAFIGAAAEAQQAKVFKIGWLGSAPNRVGFEMHKKALRTLGYIEGKNIAFEYRAPEAGKIEPLPALAEELVRLKVDLIVAIGAPPALAAKNATKTIPIVFSSGGDPVTLGLIDSLARPGGNLTGFSAIASELAGKKLELLKDTVQKLSHVAVLWDPRLAGAAEEWKESLHPARALGLQLHSMEVSTVAKYESAFSEAIKARSAALIVATGSLHRSNHKRIADLALRHRLPAISRWKDFVVSGGLMSYGPDESETYKRIPYLIDRILKGAKPADLPVERPMGFEFYINLKTAKALNLTIPPLVLMRATRVIK